MKNSNKIYFIAFSLILTATFFSIYYAPLFITKLLSLMMIGAFSEFILVHFQKKNLRSYGMGSAFAAGLLTCSLPHNMPYWQLLVGIFFASWMVKPVLPIIGIRLNSALAARLLLMLLFPNECTSWGAASIDTLSTATPQELYRAEGVKLDLSMLCLGPIQGNWMDFYTIVPGSPGSNLPLLLIILLIVFTYKNLCNRYTLIAYAISFSIINILYQADPIYNLITASSLFSMLFLFSDPYSTPKSKLGKIIFGIIIGLSNGLIRHETYYTEAMVYAVLIANLFTPFLGRFLQLKHNH